MTYYISAFEEFYAKKLGIEKLSEKSKESLIDVARHKLSVEDIKMMARAELLKDLYKNLDTIDNKASALLQFCGVILTSASIFVVSLGWLEATARDSAPHHLLKVLEPPAVLLLIGSLIAGAACLLVLNIRWSKPYEIENRTLEEACRSYYDTRTFRTKTYLFGWFVVVIVLFICGMYVLLKFFESITWIRNFFPDF